jgi:uncharacterized protein
MLHLSGDVVLDFAADDAQAFEGAERVWHVDVRRWVRRRGAFPLRGDRGEASTNSLTTGSWEQSDARRDAGRMHESWRDFRIADIVQESSTVKSFWLEPADGAKPWLHRAGQHLPVRLQLPGAGTPAMRAYTLSVAPSDGRYRISVRKQGLVSSQLHERGRVGDVVEARAPGGGFVIDAHAQRPVALVSAGIGITPMVAKLRHLVHEGLRTRRLRRTWFVHGERSAAERAFASEVRGLADAAGGAVSVVQVLSRPARDDIEGVDYHAAGRIDLALLQSVLPLDDCDFHLCGPPGFMRSIHAQLRAAGVADGRIRTEAFGPASLPGGDGAGAPPAETVPVDVLFSDSGRRARWTPQAGSLLQLAEANGLNPPSACRSGSCGSCRHRLAQGKVTHPGGAVAPLAANELLLCRAVPRQGSGPLVIEA